MNYQKRTDFKEYPFPEYISFPNIPLHKIHEVKSTSAVVAPILVTIRFNYPFRQKFDVTFSSFNDEGFELDDLIKKITEEFISRVKESREHQNKYRDIWTDQFVGINEMSLIGLRVVDIRDDKVPVMEMEIQDTLI